MKTAHRTVAIYPQAREAIATETLEALPLESGGVLLGYYEDHNMVITDALIIRSAKSTTNRYVRDDVEANRQLSEYLAERSNEDPVGYVGEWHSHPVPCQPSKTDLNAIRSTASQTTRPLALLICSWATDPIFQAVVAAHEGRGRIAVDKAEIESLTASQTTETESGRKTGWC